MEIKITSGSGTTQLRPSSDRSALAWSHLSFSSVFSPLLFWDGFIMRFHEFYFFCGILKPDSFDPLVASRSGLLVLLIVLCRALLSVLY